MPFQLDRGSLFPGLNSCLLVSQENARLGHLLREKMYVACLSVRSPCLCEKGWRKVVISFSINVALLGLFAERSSSSAKLRCSSSTSSCKHHGSRTCSLRRPILICSRFVYIYIHSLSHHGYTIIDLLLLWYCSFVDDRVDGMLTL